MNPLESAKLDLVVAYAVNSMFWSKSKSSSCKISFCLVLLSSSDILKAIVFDLE